MVCIQLKKREITRIKKDKSSLQQALPEYADRIEQLTKENGYKLRTEEEIAELINLLNRQ
jgi:cupin superfamily acireductone dioxygenase involved in methionine salvage